MKIKLKLARLWLSRKEWARLTETLRELRANEFAADAGDGQSKGTLMLELLALEIQMYREMGNLKKVKVRRHTDAGHLRCGNADQERDSAPPHDGHDPRERWQDAHGGEYVATLTQKTGRPRRSTFSRRSATTTRPAVSCASKS